MQPKPYLLILLLETCFMPRSKVQKAGATNQHFLDLVQILNSSTIFSQFSKFVTLAYVTEEGNIKIIQKGGVPKISRYSNFHYTNNFNTSRALPDLSVENGFLNKNNYY